MQHLAKFLDQLVERVSSGAGLTDGGQGALLGFI
jgi:hypothetical protein